MLLTKKHLRLTVQYLRTDNDPIVELVGQLTNVMNGIDVEKIFLSDW